MICVFHMKEVLALHEELLALDGIYTKLYNMQKLLIMI